MDEYDLDESDQGAEAQPESQETKTADVPDWVSKELRELREENKDLRAERTRLRLSKQYGDDVLDLIPTSLTLKEQEALAGKLSERLSVATPNPTENATTEQEPEEATTPAELKLAAVAGQAPGIAASPQSDMSAKDILKLGLMDPARAQREIEAKYRR